MKTLNRLIIGLLATITLISAQNTDSLSSDQKKEYNRRKLTVEQVTETSGGMGWSWGFFAKRIATWRAFKGLGNQIEAEEFFRLTGYNEEADEVRTRLEAANSEIAIGAILYIGGFVAMYIPKTEEVDYGFGVTGDVVSYPYVVPGLIAALGGAYLWYDGKLKKYRPAAPYESAADMAKEYNTKLLEELFR